jgi:C4-dicarboxylate-specific signal transduction histidine kinase
MDLVMSLIDRMASMTSQLKSFAFNRLENPSPVSFTDALQETLRLHQAELEKVDIRVRIASNISMVVGEESRIRQVLSNLISNAIDATAKQNPAQITISAHTKDEHVIIQVQDNGCGVPEGLGLGLAITANNVRDMQGNLDARNNQEQGMTFTLTLKKEGKN